MLNFSAREGSLSGARFVESKRHVPELADLTEQEAQAIGLWISRVAQALLQTEGMDTSTRFHRHGVRMSTFMDGRRPALRVVLGAEGG
jgi:hypothetical protein